MDGPDGEIISRLPQGAEKEAEMISEDMKQKLVREAIRARKNSYCRYSGFAVGAALLCGSGKIYRGANVENASYGLTNCAERSAAFAAVSAGEREFTAIAIVGAPSGEKATQICPPCGSCRQVLAEFGTPDMPVILGTETGECTERTLADLLPDTFKL